MGSAVPDRQESYGELYRTHYSRVVRLSRMLLADPHEAEEAAQDVFLKLFKEIHAGTRPVVWERWLTRVTINACRDRRRAAWWKVWRERTEVFDETRFSIQAATPEEEVLRREERRRIWRAFQKLSSRQQEVFALRHLEEWSIQEIGESLELTGGSVKRHLFRAIRHLRKAVGGRS